MKASDQFHVPGALFQEGASSTHWLTDLVGPKAGLDAVTRKYPCLSQVLNPGHPTSNLATTLSTTGLMTGISSA
jgi:hypothetical protein